MVGAGTRDVALERRHVVQPPLRLELLAPAPVVGLLRPRVRGRGRVGARARARVILD